MTNGPEPRAGVEAARKTYETLLFLVYNWLRFPRVALNLIARPIIYLIPV